MTDPYAVLELPWGAPAASIRRAYRRLALRHHPDRNPGDPGAEARFKLVTAAYQRLKDSGWSLPRAAAPSVARDEGVHEADSGARPERWPDGAPIHYPSEEDMRAEPRNLDPPAWLRALSRRSEWIGKGFVYFYFFVMVLCVAFAVIGLMVLALRRVLSW